MALSLNGPHGHLKGKIGNLVFYLLNGQPVVRTIGDPGKPSINQKGNQQAMSVTMKVFKSMKSFINSSFELEARGTVRNPFNLAISYNKKNALKGAYPNLRIDYSKIVLSYGDLPLANDLKMVKTETGVLISWGLSNQDFPALNNDMVMLMLHHPLDHRSTTVLNACRRDAGQHFIPLSNTELNEPIEAYICFKSANGKKISDSAYLGNLNGEPDTPEEESQKKKYAVLKTRFDQIELDYLQQLNDNGGNPVDSKAFRNLEKEYQVLKHKLEHLPRKPV
ncbi:hypothetical protein SAMN05421820_10696 [Pedobacter steynii]|uniref:Uncharacterized protein n=1 Tax=Pedobacter steynii TaxID=430522 RepID=A0A1G9YGI6_9SPHI|nr:DUF6266 family protein [Pedobacter steynii]NQX39699.1 hypothetical protein [Pedobacter steynii]SDN07621.1 hypothetical protein SAMN05421820_10696 [Pedobacter steynii]